MLLIQNIEWEVKPFNIKYIIKYSFKKNPWFFIIVLIIILISLLMTCTIILLKSNNTLSLDYKLVKNKTNDVLNYFITYLLPILSLNINDVASIIINSIAFIIIGLLYVKSNQLYLNPLLLLVGYYVYEVNDRIIISKKSIETLQIAIHNSSLQVRQISKNIYIEKTKLK